jgi:cytochrome o ubiquinol oxidase operon protein cyoD
VKDKVSGESSSGTSLSYLLGFILSLALTLGSYFLVKKHVNSHHLVFSDNFLLVMILLLAGTQLVVQLVFFLHLDRESKPWWNNTALAFAFMVVAILVFGSMWIMANLDYHHGGAKTHDGHSLSNPQQVNQYIIHDEGISK